MQLLSFFGYGVRGLRSARTLTVSTPRMITMRKKFPSPCRMTVSFSAKTAARKLVANAVMRPGCSPSGTVAKNEIDITQCALSRFVTCADGMEAS